MAIPLLPPLAITFGTSAIASIIVNIVQGFQNRKLRKQTEMLEKVAKNLNSDLVELKKKQDALKIWSFQERYRLEKQIAYLESEVLIKSSIIAITELELTIGNGDSRKYKYRDASF